MVAFSSKKLSAEFNSLRGKPIDSGILVTDPPLEVAARCAVEALVAL
jgi:hypothetical protein